LTSLQLQALIALAAPACFGFQSQPAATVGTVTGRVTEAHSGDPVKAIAKALIIVKDGVKHGQEAGTGAYSDNNGNFRMALEPGSYGVTVERDGYVAEQQSKVKTISVEAGQTTGDVNLEKTAQALKVAEGDRASVVLEVSPDDQ
jgi:Carboxypeptidase regulatory-like domain